MCVTPTQQSMLQDSVSLCVVLAAGAACHCPDVSSAACYTASSDPSMQFQKTAVVYMVSPFTCLPILLQSRPFCILHVSFGSAGQIDLTEWESVIQVPSISKITFSDVIWTAPSTNADSGEERHASASEQDLDDAPLVPGQAVSPMTQLYTWVCSHALMFDVGSSMLWCCSVPDCMSSMHLCCCC